MAPSCLVLDRNWMWRETFPAKNGKVFTVIHPLRCVFRCTRSLVNRWLRHPWQALIASWWLTDKQGQVRKNIFFHFRLLNAVNPPLTESLCSHRNKQHTSHPPLMAGCGQIFLLKRLKCPLYPSCSWCSLCLSTICQVWSLDITWLLNLSFFLCI